MNTLLSKISEANINDEDLDDMTVLELRSVLIHVQNCFDIEESEDEQSDEELEKYVI